LKGSKHVVLDTNSNSGDGKDLSYLPQAWKPLSCFCKVDDYFKSCVLVSAFIGPGDSDPWTLVCRWRQPEPAGMHKFSVHLHLTPSFLMLTSPHSLCQKQAHHSESEIPGDTVLGI
jgi:hypothetical protein